MIHVEDFREHLNMTADEVNVVGHAVLARFLDAAQKHTEGQLGYRLDDPVELPDGAPEDIRQAILMLAAHWFSQREATTVVTMIPVPFGFDEIVRNHRNWSFG